MTKHARLSPSASERWMQCPGSVTLIETLPEHMRNQSSEAADLGTAIHELAERCLVEDLTPEYFHSKTINGFDIEITHVAIASIYVDYVRSLRGQKFIEQRVTLEDHVEECFGTCDAVVVNDRHIEIVDLKTGRFPVSAVDNSQLMIYALGAVLGHGGFESFERITMTIVQPLSGGVKSHSVSAEELQAFMQELKLSAERIVTRAEHYQVGEKTCKFCAAKAICPAQRAIATRAAAADFQSVVGDEFTLADWLGMLPHLRAFADGLEEYARELLLDGQSIEGFELSKPQRRRYWKSTSALMSYIEDRGLHDAFMQTTLLTPAQVEKAGFDLQDLQDYVVVKETTPRVIKAQSADGFDDI